MSVISLSGDFQVNGVPAQEMQVDASRGVRVRTDFGYVAVIATSPEGIPVKGVAPAEPELLDSIARISPKAVIDPSIRIPENF